MMQVFPGHPLSGPLQVLPSWIFHAFLLLSTSQYFLLLSPWDCFVLPDSRIASFHPLGRLNRRLKRHFVASISATDRMRPVLQALDGVGDACLGALE